MAHISYGIPLALSLAGTVGSLAAGSKRAHVLCGTALTVLSLLHAYQHRRAMVRKAGAVWRGKADQPAAASSPLEEAAVAFYMPGRIRLYSRRPDELAACLQGFCRIGSVAVNPESGSVLVSYEPQRLSAHPGLARTAARLKMRAAACR